MKNERLIISIMLFLFTFFTAYSGQNPSTFYIITSEDSNKLLKTKKLFISPNNIESLEVLSNKEARQAGLGEYQVVMTVKIKTGIKLIGCEAITKGLNAPAANNFKIDEKFVASQEFLIEESYIKAKMLDRATNTIHIITGAKKSSSSTE
jgi:hypothetical protein